jgi:hypothetical protein
MFGRVNLLRDSLATLRGEFGNCGNPRLPTSTFRFLRAVRLAFESLVTVFAASSRLRASVAKHNPNS